MMYLQHFGLKDYPFRTTPDPAFLFWTADLHHAFGYIKKVSRREIPMALILGEPGTGKTTLLRDCVAKANKFIEVGMLFDYASGEGGLCHWINHAFAWPRSKPGTGHDLRAGIEAQLLARDRVGVRCLLVVDEAQHLSDEDLAVLLGLTRFKAAPNISLGLVLAGSTTLRHNLRKSTPRDMHTEITPLCIGYLSRDEVSGYIHHRMSVAGGLNPVFEDAAIDIIADRSAGIPRLVNAHCDLLLVAAFGGGKQKVTAAFASDIFHDAQRTGFMLHLPAHGRQPANKETSGPTKVTADYASEQTSAEAPAATFQRPPGELGVEQTTAKARADNTYAAVSKGAIALPSPTALKAHAATTTNADRHHNERAGLAYLVFGSTAAAVVLAIFFYPSSPLEPDPTPQAPTDIKEDSVVDAAAQVHPALSAPLAAQGSNARSFQDQALIAGEHDPHAAAIGFARAALRGDARAAYFLGQFFETGDGVPQNTALAAAWYHSASQTQRGARRALQSMTETTRTPQILVEASTDPPLPLMGVALEGNMAEFVWAMPESVGAQFLVELADTPAATPEQYGPFVLSAVMLNADASAKLWRVVSVGRDGARIAASDWHLIDTEKTEAMSAAP